jgi:hypothetical protein
MATNLAAGGAALLASGLLLTAEPRRAFGRTPAPGAVLRMDTPLVQARRPFEVPGLSGAQQFTLVLVADKLPAAEDLYMLAAILTQGQGSRTWAGYTGRNYSVNAGLTYNTYVDGFVGAEDKTIFDGGRQRLLTIEFQRAGVKFYAGGQLLATIPYRNSQQALAWSDTIYLGGEPDNAGYTWPGTIYVAYGYLGLPSAVDQARTEAFELELYPDAT